MIISTWLNLQPTGPAQRTQIHEFTHALTHRNIMIEARIGLNLTADRQGGN